MKFTNSSILFIILIVATVLRTYDLFNIPFTHDELSALFRLRFDSFGEIIEQGVKVDGHPAGGHVFLYYWTKIFGASPWVFKIPFIIAGVLSSLLIYKIAQKWFNETVGLIAASYLATIQFTVMYSQIGRPYISGLFLTLLMVYFWTKLIKSPEKNFYRNGVLFILSATLCAYNHHFSLLFAVVVSLTGIFLLPKNKILPYSLFGLGIFILYLPHLSIFFHQLGYGGLGGEDGWLTAPRYDFLPNFIHYLFNYSTFSIIVAVMIIIYGVRKNKFKLTFPKKYLIFISFFLIPFLIGFYYSRIFNPVLQFSVLIFSFPYLYFLFFGHLKEQSRKTNFIIVGVILIANTFSLIWNRQHYSIFYQSVYEHVLIDHQLNEDKNLPRIIESNPRFTEYYIQQGGIDTNFIRFESFEDIAEFKVAIEKISQTNDELFLGTYSTSEPRLVPIILEYFPKIKSQHNYFLGSTYVFSKKIARSAGIKSVDIFDIKQTPNSRWENIQEKNIQENGSLLFDKNLEYGLVYQNNLFNLSPNSNNCIDISIEAKSEEVLSDILIVAQINGKNNEQLHWSGADFNNFHSKKGEWNTFYHTVKLSDIQLGESRENCTIKILIWNKAKKTFVAKNFKIQVRYGNPKLYGVFRKI